MLRPTPPRLERMRPGFESPGDERGVAPPADVNVHAADDGNVG